MPNQTLRLSEELAQKIEAVKPGHQTRHSWVLDAIAEKIERDSASQGDMIMLGFTQLHNGEFAGDCEMCGCKIDTIHVGFGLAPSGNIIVTGTYCAGCATTE